MDNQSRMDFGHCSPRDRAAVLEAIKNLPVARLKSGELKQALLVIAELLWPEGRREADGELTNELLVARLERTLNTVRRRRQDLVALGWLIEVQRSGRPVEVRLNCVKLFGLEETRPCGAERGKDSEGDDARLPESCREHARQETGSRGNGPDGRVSPGSAPAADALRWVVEGLRRLLPMTRPDDMRLRSAISKLLEGSNAYLDGRWRGPDGDWTPPEKRLDPSNQNLAPSNDFLEGSNQFPSASRAIPEGNRDRSLELDDDEFLNNKNSSSSFSLALNRLDPSKTTLEGSNRPRSQLSAVPYVAGMDLTVLGWVDADRMQRFRYGRELFRRWQVLGLFHAGEETAWLSLWVLIWQSDWKKRKRLAIVNPAAWLRKLVWNGQWRDLVSGDDLKFGEEGLRRFEAAAVTTEGKQHV